MFPAWAMHNIDFRDLLEEYELSLGNRLAEKVYLALTDPPYNVRRVWNDKNAMYDRLSTSDMGGVVNVGKSMIVIKR